MEELYKEHLIRSGVQPVPESTEWKPTVEVFWIENGKERTKRWMEWDFDRAFPTEKLAEIEAHLFARKWIDDGKP